MTGFYKELMLLFATSVNNFFPDNFDRQIRKLGMRRSAMVLFEAMFERVTRLFGIDASIVMVGKNSYFLRHIEEFENTYELLADEDSKKRYVEILAYKMLGFTKVRLSLNNHEFVASRSRASAFRRAERIPIKFRNGYLGLYDLSDAGYDLRLYFVDNGIFVDFMLQQYSYRDFVSVDADDVVIDVGGCWGDTALYFAAKGAARVLVYEFIPSNVAIFERNMAINPRYSGNIELVDKAAWETSGLDLSFDDRGPASRVAGPGLYDGATQTLAIDDLVREKNLGRVDFIKMDIEGAELSALKGAEATIRRHRPKLAISVYHKPNDMVSIPEYIQSLNPDYQFYLDYYTIVGDEIILYAIDKHGK